MVLEICSNTLRLIDITLDSSTVNSNSTIYDLFFNYRRREVVNMMDEQCLMLNSN